ncbi:unnamed protein product [Calypogeia fissa]
MCSVALATAAVRISFAALQKATVVLDARVALASPMLVSHWGHVQIPPVPLIYAAVNITSVVQIPAFAELGAEVDLAMAVQAYAAIRILRVVLIPPIAEWGAKGALVAAIQVL